MSRTTSFDSRSDSFDLDQQNRSRVFSSIFSLPDEELVDDFTCALLKSSVLLFQGRLFVSRDHICFYSALLSAEGRTIIIPFENISEISKKNTAWVVPNAIEICLKDGTEYFFASFLSRNRCYDLLQDIYRKESTPEISSSAVEASRDSSPSQSVDLTHDTSLPVPEVATSPADDLTAPDLVDKVQSELHTTLTQCYELSLDQFEAKLCDTYWGKSGLEFKESGRAEFPFPTKDVFPKLYADSGTVYSAQQHLESLGATDVKISSWKVDKGIMVRNGSLIMPISNILSTVKRTRVQESCYCCYDPVTHSFHFRSQSVSMDAPYGDHFTVLLAYDFSPAEDNDQRCSVSGRVAVYFIKSVWAVKSIIVSSTIDGVRNAFDLWFKSVISACSEGQEIPMAAIRRESCIDRIEEPKKRLRFALPSFIQFADFGKILTKQRHFVFASVCISLIAIMVSSLSFNTTKFSENTSDMCFMIPDIMSKCSQMGNSLPDLFIAELYSNALLARVRTYGHSVPKEINVAINDLNQILHEYITMQRKGDTKLVVKRLQDSTQRLRLYPKTLFINQSN